MLLLTNSLRNSLASFAWVNKPLNKLEKASTASLDCDYQNSKAGTKNFPAFFTISSLILSKWHEHVFLILAQLLP